jgi:hypothetical protein
MPNTEAQRSRECGLASYLCSEYIWQTQDTHWENDTRRKIARLEWMGQRKNEERQKKLMKMLTANKY